MHSGRGVCGLQQVRSVAVSVFGFECHNGTMPFVCMVVAVFLLSCPTAMERKRNLHLYFLCHLLFDEFIVLFADFPYLPLGLKTRLLLQLYFSLLFSL